MAKDLGVAATLTVLFMYEGMIIRRKQHAPPLAKTPSQKKQKKEQCSVIPQGYALCSHTTEFIQVPVNSMGLKLWKISLPSLL